MKYTLLAISLLMITIVSAQPNPLSKDMVDDLAQKLIKKGPVKALSVGIIQNGTTYIYHYGDLGNGQPATNNSLFELASITKTFTGLLLAKAVLDQRIKLDDDIRPYLDGSFPNLEYNKIPVSFRNLATHRAGLPYNFPDKPELFINPDYDKLPFMLDSLEKGFTKADFFAALHQVKLDAAPGTQFRYSNADANLLAYLLEKIYSRSYEELLAEYVFKKAGMEHTSLLITGPDTLNLVQGYNTKRMKMPFVSPAGRAAAGLKSTLPDIMKYVAVNLNETDSLIQTAHDPIWKADKGAYAAGFYWQMDKVQGDRKIFQNGGSFGTSSWMEFYPDSGIGIFLVTNVSGQEIHPLLSAMSDKLYKMLTKK